MVFSRALLKSWTTEWSGFLRCRLSGKPEINRKRVITSFHEYLSDLYIEKLSSQWWTLVGYLRNRGKNLGQCATPWSFQYFGEFFYLDFGSRSDSPSRVKIYFAMILAGRRFRPQCRNRSFYCAWIRLDRKKFCGESRLDLKIFLYNKNFEINLGLKLGKKWFLTDSLIF